MSDNPEAAWVSDRMRRALDDGELAFQDKRDRVAREIVEHLNPKDPRPMFPIKHRGGEVREQ